MSAVAAEAAAAVDGSAPVRRQRVRVPMRLVSSPHYQDVALSVYVKVKALGMRPEGCQAKSTTIASYLGMSPVSGIADRRCGRCEARLGRTACESRKALWSPNCARQARYSDAAHSRDLQTVARRRSGDRQQTRDRDRPRRF